MHLPKCVLFGHVKTLQRWFQKSFWRYMLFIAQQPLTFFFGCMNLNIQIQAFVEWRRSIGWTPILVIKKIIFSVHLDGSSCPHLHIPPLVWAAPTSAGLHPEPCRCRDERTETGWAKSNYCNFRCSCIASEKLAAYKKWSRVNRAVNSSWHRLRSQYVYFFCKHRLDPRHK